MRTLYSPGILHRLSSASSLLTNEWRSEEKNGKKKTLRSSCDIVRHGHHLHSPHLVCSSAFYRTHTLKRLHARTPIIILKYTKLWYTVHIHACNAATIHFGIFQTFLVMFTRHSSVSRNSGRKKKGHTYAVICALYKNK